MVKSTDIQALFQQIIANSDDQNEVERLARRGVALVDKLRDETRRLTRDLPLPVKDVVEGLVR